MIGMLRVSQKLLGHGRLHHHLGLLSHEAEGEDVTLRASVRSDLELSSVKAVLLALI